MRAPRLVRSVAPRLLLAAAMAFAAPLFAFADACNFTDAGQAAKNIGTSDFWKQCSDEFDDSTYWGLLIFLTAGAVGEDIQQTGATGYSQPPNYVTQFCATALNDINSGTSNTVQDVINALPDSVKQSATDALNDVLGDTASTDLASVGDAFICACQSITLNGLAQFGSVVGACEHDAACQLSHNTLECCPQSPSPLQHIDCSQRPCASPTDSDCTTNPSLVFTGVAAAADDCGNLYAELPYCVGDTCYSQDPFQPNNGSATLVCSCPIAMQLKVEQPSNGQNGYIQCVCPPGSTQQGNQCVCPGGATISWNGGNVAPNCPPAPPSPPVCAPTCGPGQTVAYTDQANCKYACQCPDGQVSVNGACVTPCTGGEVMLGSGACCKASQATTCGVCCPNGMTPDQTGATCVVKPIPIKAQFLPNKPRPGQSFRPTLGKP